LLSDASFVEPEIQGASSSAFVAVFLVLEVSIHKENTGEAFAAASSNLIFLSFQHAQL
jgi:hypothetical protein